MKKINIYLFIALTFSMLYSCQDEFCLDATTPNLIIRFYDKDTIANTKALNLIVSANDLDTLFNGSSIDSLYIPLDTQNNTVTYHLSIIEENDDDDVDSEVDEVDGENSQENVDDDEDTDEVEEEVYLEETLTISYNTEDVFVSKACGYKTIFNNFKITITNNNFIDNSNVLVTEITNQDEAHVQIFH